MDKSQNNSKEEFAKRLLLVIERLGMNQAEFAKSIGSVDSTLSGILSGNHGAGYKFLNQLANTFPVNINYLFTGSGEPFLDPSLNMDESVTYSEDIKELIKAMELSKIIKFKVLVFFTELINESKSGSEIAEVKMKLEELKKKNPRPKTRKI